MRLMQYIYSCIYQVWTGERCSPNSFCCRDEHSVTSAFWKSNTTTKHIMWEIRVVWCSDVFWWDAIFLYLHELVPPITLPKVLKLLLNYRLCYVIFTYASVVSYCFTNKLLSTVLSAIPITLPWSISKHVIMTWRTRHIKCIFTEVMGSNFLYRNQKQLDNLRGLLNYSVTEKSRVHNAIVSSISQRPIKLYSIKYDLKHRYNYN